MVGYEPIDAAQRSALLRNSRLGHEREFVSCVTPSATNHSRTRDEAPVRAFFLFGSKGFNEANRLSETGRWPEIGLRTPCVSFHPPFTPIETHQKMVVFSDACQKWVAPQLRPVRLLSKQTETLEGGVVVRGGANDRVKSLMTNRLSAHSLAACRMCPGQMKKTT